MKTFYWGLVMLLLLVACGRSVPGQPQSVSVARVSNGLLVTWKDNSSGEIQETGFVVKRNGTKITTQAPNVTKYLDEFTVNPDITYSYVVCAVINGEEVCSKESKYPDDSSGGKVKLTVIREGTGNGVITSSPAGINCNHATGTGCSAEFTKGTKVTLTVAPNAGSSFVGFSNNCTKTGDLTCDIVMDGNKEVTENLVSAKPGLNVEVTGKGRIFDIAQGGPYINCGNGNTDCLEDDYWPVGSIVTLFAEPSAASIFSGWKGCDKISNSKTLINGRCDLTLKAVSVVQATFLSEDDIPVINSFTATPGNIPDGQTEDVTLAWQIDALPEAFTQIVVSDGDIEVCTASTLDAEGKGSCLVNDVSEAKTYRITVEGPFDPDPFREVAVSFGAEPTVDLSITPDKLAVGEEAVLAWVVGGSATNRKVVLSGGEFTNEDVTADSDSQIKVMPIVDTTYTITVTNDAGTITDQVTIDVGLKPVIVEDLSATPLAVEPGGAVTLSWKVTDATKLTLEPLGVVTGDSTTDNPESDTVYTLRAENDFGETVSNSVTVQVGKAPSITDFKINGDDGSGDHVPIAKGGSALITWSVGGGGTGLDIKIRRTGAVINETTERTGSFTDGPLNAVGTITYRITATNAFGTAEPKEIKVDVGELPSFTQGLVARDAPGGNEINEITLGQTIYFDWAVSGAESVTISPTPTVMGSSSAEDTPTSTGNIPYTLTATNRFGPVSGGSVTITVLDLAPPEPPTISLFRASDTRINQGDSTTLEWQVEGTPPLTVTLDDEDELTDPIKVDPEGNLLVSPSITTTYTLTATNEVDSDSKTVTIRVRD